MNTKAGDRDFNGKDGMGGGKTGGHERHPGHEILGASGCAVEVKKAPFGVPFGARRRRKQGERGGALNGHAQEQDLPGDRDLCVLYVWRLLFLHPDSD